MSTKNVSITVASVVVAEAGFIKWIQGTGTTYTVAVDTWTDYITVTDTSGGLALSDLRTNVVFSKAGTLSTGTGTFRWYNSSGRTLTLATIAAAVGTAPVGAAILCDVNIDGSTIWATQANRVTIADGASVGTQTTFDTTTIATGAHYFTVDIDQVGSGTAGSDLTVTIWMTG